MEVHEMFFFEFLEVKNFPRRGFCKPLAFVVRPLAPPVESLPS